MGNKIAGIIMLTGTLFLGSCAQQVASTEGKHARVEETMSTLDNVSEINFKKLRFIINFIKITINKQK